MMQQALNSIRRQWFKVSKKVQAKNSLEYVKHLSVIWSRPLSDFNRVIATNQLALPVFIILIWTQQWPITELRAVDGETRKIIHENGGKHPLSSTAVMYLPRHLGGPEIRLTWIQAHKDKSRCKALSECRPDDESCPDVWGDSSGERSFFTTNWSTQICRGTGDKFIY